MSGCNSQADTDAPLPTVYIKETEGKYELIRNGKPFYIKGGAAHPDFLPELKEAGANTARIYDTINLAAVLDDAHSLGLAAVVDIPLPQYIKNPEYFEDEELFLKMKDRIERVVEEHKDHPALLYWNLGNELFYPYLYKLTKFHSNYNTLIDLIHDLDPNHPVSTTTIGANKLRVLSIITRSPQLDFISFNSFGTLSIFSEKLDPIAPVWTGPHVITEWGINGPWEANVTAWRVPIEETSTKKAEQIKERHDAYIKPLQSKNSLGSFIFYWGSKMEETPTWFSLFDEQKRKTQAVHELSQIWNNSTMPYNGPKLEYMLLNQRGAAESIMLLPNSIAEAEVILPDGDAKNIEFRWEVKHDSWHNRLRSFSVDDFELHPKENKVSFTIPEQEGPYRIYVYITNGTEYTATANIPFYVLSQQDGE